MVVVVFVAGGSEKDFLGTGAALAFGDLAATGVASCAAAGARVAALGAPGVTDLTSWVWPQASGAPPKSGGSEP